jgi:hypothetical protein
MVPWQGMHGMSRPTCQHRGHVSSVSQGIPDKFVAMQQNTCIAARIA